MKQLVWLALAVSAVSATATAREIRDPAANFTITIPKKWSATTQSSKDGSSIMWAFLSPTEHFRFIVRVYRSVDKRPCKELMVAYEKNELKDRLRDYTKLPTPPEDEAEMTKDSCGGSYVGMRRNKRFDQRPYIVFLGITRKGGPKGGTITRILGEAEYDTFGKRSQELVQVMESFKPLEGGAL